jgi:hypothetical protein
MESEKAENVEDDLQELKVCRWRQRQITGKNEHLL